MKHNTLVFLFRWSLSLCKRFILSCVFFILCAAPYSIVKSMKRTGILKRYECDLFTIKFIHMIAISFFLMFCLRPKSRAYACIYTLYKVQKTNRSSCQHFVLVLTTHYNESEYHLVMLFVLGWCCNGYTYISILCGFFFNEN